MYNPIYELQEIEMIGGEYHPFIFNLKTQRGEEFDATGCDVEFSVLNYSFKSGAALIVKDLSLRTSENGALSVGETELTPEETALLYGVYIYQISIRDPDGVIKIPGQGILKINRNIHPEFITE